MPLILATPLQCIRDFHRCSCFCPVSAEDYDDFSDASVERSPSRRAFGNDDAQGQGRRHGYGHVLVDRPIRARFSRHRNMPVYRQQLTEFD